MSKSVQKISLYFFWSYYIRLLGLLSFSTIYSVLPIHIYFLSSFFIKSPLKLAEICYMARNLIVSQYWYRKLKPKTSENPLPNIKLYSLNLRTNLENFRAVLNTQNLSCCLFSNVGQKASKRGNPKIFKALGPSTYKQIIS